MTDSNDLCHPFLDVLAVDGVSIAVLGRNGPHVSISSSGRTAARVEELQFDLGEGPQWDCIRTSLPILIPDVARADGRWPMFLAAVAALPVCSIFTLPLNMGAATVGVVTLHRADTGPLTPRELSDGITMAASIAGVAADRAFRLAIYQDDEGTAASPGLRREVHQATGMVLVQLGTTATEAFARLQAHAFANNSTVQRVAVDVLERRLDFSRLPD